jgi:hypothetical protein
VWWHHAPCNAVPSPRPCTVLPFPPVHLRLIELAPPPLSCTSPLSVLPPATPPAPRVRSQTARMIEMFPGCYGRIDKDGSRFLLADREGRLFAVVLGRDGQRVRFACAVCRAASVV